MDCFEGFRIDWRSLILSLTSSFAVSYANVGTYEFKKVTTVRTPISPPSVLTAFKSRPFCAEIPGTMPVFRDCEQAYRTAENGLFDSEGRAAVAFLRRANAQSGFKHGIRRMQRDHKPGFRPS
jgi:hypothetical protein